MGTATFRGHENKKESDLITDFGNILAVSDRDKSSLCGVMLAVVSASSSSIKRFENSSHLRRLQGQ